MRMCFRWFGEDDPVPLRFIRQIPGVTGIVSALHHLPAGVVWPRAELEALRAEVESAGLVLPVIESIPVHEEIKLGAPERDRWIDAYCRSIEHLGEAGIPVLCYNFMPVFDWTRTELARVLDDGSSALAFDQEALDRIDLSRGTQHLPGWAGSHDRAALEQLIADYRAVDDERLWENLAYFLERVVPVAETARVNLAVHPDDPPWPVFGLPRILTGGPALERLIGLVESPANGVTFCTGSLGADENNDLPSMITRLGQRIHFAHCRNVRREGPRRFHESAHPSEHGSIDMVAVLRALHDAGFRGPARPDHGRMIWDEVGRPGYGLHDRALGATYLQGIWEAVRSEGSRPKEAP